MNYITRRECRMLTLIELRQKLADTVGEMDKLLTGAEAEEGRAFTEEEETKYVGLEEVRDGLEKDIAEAEKVEARKAKVDSDKADLAKIVKPTREVIVHGDKELGKDGGFKNIGEFFAVIARSHMSHDPRLQELRVTQMKDGVKGGFAIPEQFLPEVLSVESETALVRPRARVIPAGSPPDSQISLPVADQGASQNRFWGVTINHDGESDSITETNLALKQVTLKPKRLSGYMTASNELIDNWAASAGIIPTLLREAMTAAEDVDFYTGDGVNKSLGVLNSGAVINYNRAAASSISFADVTGMFARSKIGGTKVWVASQTTIPQLVTIADAGSNSIWVNSVVPGLPPTLYGIPVLFYERSPVLGSRGDLTLIDFSFYLIKDGSGPFVALSEHFRFQNNEVAFRIVWHVDGQSWLDEAILLEGSTSDTVSPYVVLDTP